MQNLEQTPVAPGWLLIDDQLVNTNNLIRAKSVKSDTSKTVLHYLGGDTLTINVGLRMFAAILNDALLTATLSAPEQAMVNDLRAENSILKSQNESRK